MIKNKRILIQTYGKISYNTALLIVNKVIMGFIENNNNNNNNCTIYSCVDYNGKSVICYVTDNGKSIKFEIYYQKEEEE